MAGQFLLAFREALESRKKSLKKLMGLSRHGHDHRRSENTTHGAKLAIVGNPNTGKSVMFNNLTGSYVTVSNYPGTTVEVSRGKGKIREEEFEIVDTPGMYSLLPITEDERVARSILLREKPDVILQLIDAKNLERMLPLTLQLIEAGLPVVLDLNIIDEAERIGIRIDVDRLERELDIPVVATVATTGQGVKDLKRRLYERAKSKN